MVQKCYTQRVEILRTFEHPQRWPAPIPSEATELERAYAAGMVDGEGTILLTQWGSSYLPYVNVTNTNQTIIDWLLQRFGGSSYRSGRKNPRHKPAIRWTLSGRHATTFIAEIQPYLVIKQEQARLLLTYYEGDGHFHYGNRQLPAEEMARRQALHDAISALNRRGVSVDLSDSTTPAKP